MFQCPQRAEWRMKFLQQCQDYLQKIKTPSILSQLIMTYIHDIFKEHLALSHFRHFTIFAGLLPSQWNLTPMNPTEYSSSFQYNKWAILLSQWLTIQGHQLWKDRSQQLHEDHKDETTTKHLLNQKN